MRPSNRSLIHPFFTTRSGFSLLEAIIAAGLMAGVIGGTVVILRSSVRGMTAVEARTVTVRVAMDSIDRLQHTLAASTRLFENNTAGNAYLGRLSLSSAPAALTNSRLPSIEEYGSLSPSSSTFVAASAGNTLFFAERTGAQIISVTLDPTAPSRSYAIDTYRFYYYYVAPTTAQSIGGVARNDLEEWKSVLYADAAEIQNIPDSATRIAIINGMISAGVIYGWTVAQNDPSAAFYSLHAGAMTSLPTHQVVQGSVAATLKIPTGVGGGSFHYGISPNRSLTFTPKDPVPLYATASGSYPAGFEVVIVGSAMARQVLARLVLVAQGSFPGYPSTAQTTVISVSDRW